MRSSHWDVGRIRFSPRQYYLPQLLQNAGLGTGSARTAYGDAFRYAPRTSNGATGTLLAITAIRSSLLENPYQENEALNLNSAMKHVSSDGIMVQGRGSINNDPDNSALPRMSRQKFESNTDVSSFVQNVGKSSEATSRSIIVIPFTTRLISEQKHTINDIKMSHKPHSGVLVEKTIVPDEKSLGKLHGQNLDMLHGHSSGVLHEQHSGLLKDHVPEALFEQPPIAIHEKALGVLPEDPIKEIHEHPRAVIPGNQSGILHENPHGVIHENPPGVIGQISQGVIPASSPGVRPEIPQRMTPEIQQGVIPEIPPGLIPKERTVVTGFKPEIPTTGSPKFSPGVLNVQSVEVFIEQPTGNLLDLPSDVSHGGSPGVLNKQLPEVPDEHTKEVLHEHKPGVIDKQLPAVFHELPEIVPGPTTTVEEPPHTPIEQPSGFLPGQPPGVVGQDSPDVLHDRSPDKEEIVPVLHENPPPQVFVPERPQEPPMHSLSKY